MELIYYLIFLDRDKMDVYWDKTLERILQRESKIFVLSTSISFFFY